MAALGEDRYAKLKSTVDSWAAEVTEVRSALADRLSVEMDRARPAFRLHREREVIARESIAPAQPTSDSREHSSRLRIEKQRLDQELEFAREQLQQISRTAEEARQRADEKAEQLEEMARAFGRTRLDLNDALEQLRAKEWALLQTANENSLLRGDADTSTHARTVPVDDYDALVESHMAIRAEVMVLQERVVQREHEILGLRENLDAARAELSAWELAGPASGAGIAKLAGVIADRSAALERIEGTAQGQELLIGALRQELDAARHAIEQREFDHERLAQALRAEIEGLRAVSSERDFVIGHQSQSIESDAFQVDELRAQLAEAQEQCESLRARAQQSADEQETTARELQMLRTKAAEREAEIWRLRGTTPSTRAADSSEPGLAQLQAALASRDAELVRARARIAFLRGQSREAAGLTAMADAFAPDAVPRDTADERERESPSDGLSLDLAGIQPNSNLQREVEAALAAEFPWYLVAALGGIAGLGLLVLGVIAMVLV